MNTKQSFRMMLFAPALCLLAARAGAGEWTANNFPFAKGMTLGLYHQDPDISYERDLDEIAALGCDWVSLAVVFFQDDYDSSFMYARTGRTAPDFRIRETIDAAHERGLKVVLFPYVLLADASEGKWRGAIAPKDLGSWWRSYQSHILRYAQIAEEHGAEAFFVGSELSSMDHYSDRWRGVIREVRKVYSGKLSFSANWDKREIDWWDALDFIAMSCYFELADSTEPTMEEIVERWQPYFDEIEEWHGRVGNGKPLIMSEVGYHSRDGVAQYPWDYTKASPIDLEEQKLCYEAFRKVWAGAPFLNGVFFYAWFEEGGPDDPNYTPRGKPALDVIRDWYRGDSSGPDAPGGSVR
jgi:hypothetical protein